MKREQRSGGWRLVLGLVAALLLSSCYETEQSFTLNPDGSGKVVHECRFQDVRLDGNDDEVTEEDVKEAVAKLMEESKGVEVWKDVDFRLLDDGRMWFRGTAYFKELEALEIPNQTMLDFGWKADADGAGELVMVKDDGEEEPGELAPKLNAEEKAKKLKSERQEYQRSKPMFAAVLGGMKHQASFRLPGKLAASSNFKKDADGGLRISFSGAKMVEALDQLVGDDEWLAENGMDQEDGPAFDDKLIGLMFGEEAPVKAVVSGARDGLFDYAAEVAAAKDESELLKKKLGVVMKAAPAAGEPLKGLRVVGTRLSRELDKKLELRPFNYDGGYTVAVLAELPGSVLDLTDKCEVLTAVADDGSDLIKGDSDWDRRISFPRLSKDQATVLFEVDLKLPGPGVRGLRELSGMLQYRVASEVKEIQLGLKSFEVGAKGDGLGAEIKSVEPVSDGEQEFTLKLDIGPKDLIAAYVVDGEKERKLERRGYSSSGGRTSFDFVSDRPLPEGGTVMVEKHDSLEVFEVPFRLENLSLTGNPLE